MLFSAVGGVPDSFAGVSKRPRPRGIYRIYPALPGDLAVGWRKSGRLPAPAGVRTGLARPPRGSLSGLFVLPGHGYCRTVATGLVRMPRNRALAGRARLMAAGLAWPFCDWLGMLVLSLLWSC